MPAKQYDMGVDVFPVLTRQTSNRHETLGQVVRELAAAAEPLQHKFTGEGAAVFAEFHAHSNEIADELDRRLASVLEGIQGQQRGFVTGDQAMADSTRATMGSISWDSGRFGAR